MSTNDTDRFLEIILNSNTDELTNKSHSTNFILAVTACPVGIAHTYMAADSLRRCC